MSSLFAKSFDLASSKLDNQPKIVFRKQRSLKESHSTVYNDSATYSIESESRNHWSSKFSLPPKYKNEEYDIEIFDVEDQADKAKSW